MPPAPVLIASCKGETSLKMHRETRYLAASVQAAPAYLDKDGGVARTIELIDQAVSAGARLIAFPECWIPGYPWWAWLGAPAWGMQFVQRHFDNCLTADGPEVALIAQHAMSRGIYAVLGYSERDGGSAYIAQLHIDPFDRTVTTRRKLKATHVERTIFGEGDGSDFFVRETPLGRIGALCCWEHLNPLNKFAMYSQNEQVHIGAWPGFSLYEGKAFALGAELNTSVSQVYAAEGQCFVIAASTLVTAEIQEMICDSDFNRDLLPVGGGAARIFGPDGRPLGQNLPDTQEGLLLAEIDLDMITLAKAAADPAGHYSRPDVFQLLANRERRRPVISNGSPVALRGKEIPLATDDGASDLV
jgi:nitrilase